MRRRHFEGAAVAAWLLACAGLALAQPANDDCANATVIGSLPFTETVDTTTATNDGDASAGGFGCALREHSVWYQYTAGASDEQILVDVFEGSAYIETTVGVYSGACGALVFAPDSGQVSLAGENDLIPVAAGATVHICIGDDDYASQTGGDVRVSVFTNPDVVVTPDGFTADNSRAAMSANTSGDFLVAWGAGDAVRARLYALDGTPLSAEAVIGGPTSRNFVGGDTMGSDDFVVAWRDTVPNPDQLVAAIVDETGSAVGTPFQVNAATSFSDPSVAGNASGFVVAWSSNRVPTARLFDTTGAALGPELPLTASTTVSATLVEVDMDTSGNFVAVWKDATRDAVVARHFDATGAALGAEFVVEQGDGSYYGFPELPDVAVAPDGTFLVVWEDASLPGAEDKDILARAYEPASSVGGALIQVNQQTLVRQHEARAGVDANGNFVVVWEDDGGRAGYGYIDMEGRRLHPTGAPLGDQFLVSAANQGYQYLPDVGVAPGGEFMVVWNGDTYVPPSDSSVVIRGFAADAFLGMECPPVAAAGCRGSILPGKSKLLLRNDGTDPEDLAINWKLVRAEATAATDYGDPLGTDDLYFCLYDAGGALVTQAALPASGLCAGKPCWKGLGKPAGAKGFKYKDKERTPNGVLKAVLKAGAEGKAKIVFKAGRGNLATGPAGGPPAIPIAGSLTAQLHAPATGTCWGATFDAATAKRNAAGIFQASSD